MPASTLDDPLLRAVPTVEGYKFLPPCLITDKLGGGGMGMVYRGYHTKLEIDVAVKVLSPMVASQDPRFVERFQREARLAARIAPDNPNLIHVYDVAETCGLHYIVMELVRGETVRERVQRKGKLGEREAIRILAGAANGLAAAHVRGVVHRDIKPDNLMVTREGRVKVADLGLAKADPGADPSMSIVMGTPKYMAPEHWQGMEHVKPPADVWALGATLFFMLAGRDPFSGSSQGQPFPDLAAALPQVSGACRTLLATAVADDPAARFADAQALVEAISAQWPDSGERLADPDAGKGTIRATTVTPPPQKTVQVARQTAVDVADAVTIAPRAQQQPARAPEQRVGAPRWLLATAAAAVLGLGVYAGLAWLRRDAGESPALRTGREQIKRRETLDAGILSLQDALRQDPGNRAIAAELAKGMFARATASGDLVARLAAAQIAADLGGPPEAAPLLARLRDEVKERLIADVEISPKAGAVVGENVDVRVEVKPSAIVSGVRIQDAPGDQLVADRAQAAVALAGEGPHQIKVLLAGPGDVTVPVTIDVVVDTRPPEVEITSPADQSTVGRTVTILGTVRDASRVQVQARVVGFAAQDGVVQGGEFQVELAVPAAAPERFRVEVVATDEARRISAPRTLDLRIDNTALVITPVDLLQRTNAATAVVRVRADGAARVTIVGVDALPVAGVWAATVPLREGRNVLEVMAVGSGDRRARLELAIDRDSVAPTFAALQPQQATAGETVAVSGRLSERAQLTIDGQAVSVGEDLSFVYSLALERTRAVPIELRARDACDNEGTAEIAVEMPAARAVKALPKEWQHEVLGDKLGPSGYPARVRDRRSGIVFLLVEPGEFVMGQSQSLQRDEQPEHRVRISKAFYLAEKETTLAQWRRITGDKSGRGTADDHPVSAVSYDDVQAFLRGLNGGGRGSFRLPTEAEWEYACRAGTRTKFAFGDELTTKDANIGGSGTQAGGKYAPNAWGFFDMHGNVAEWCEDVYDPNYYRDSPAEDPMGPKAAGDRVVRGGSYLSVAPVCGSASRRSSKGADKLVGFRVARSL